MKQNIFTMKTLYLFIFLLLIFFSFYCKVQKSVDEVQKIRIGIINPSVGSLRGFADLTENHILNIENLLFVAINYGMAEKNYMQVKEFIKDRNDDLFRFQLIEGELKAENLFEKNALSEQFETIFRDTDGLFFLGGTDFPPNHLWRKNQPLIDYPNPA